ncbi:MAG: hypothetical protein J7L53_02355 [Deltaproteobacteria bacterium]|nr:hypothetical protein [Deltaproteobacteria bacterium]
MNSIYPSLNKIREGGERSPRRYINKGDTTYLADTKTILDKLVKPLVRMDELKRVEDRINTGYWPDPVMVADKILRYALKCIIFNLGL